ncbi:hypothetical protein Pcinc_042761, partial [Petrolisthes cinctipes]
TRINVSMVIYSIMVNEANQMLELSGDLIQEWDDPKLKLLTGNYNIESVPLSGVSATSVVDKVWRPDLTAAKQVRVRGQDTGFLRIKKGGHLTWIQRVQYDFPCHLDLGSYPLNAHKCKLILASLGYYTVELDPAWKNTEAVTVKDVVVSHGYILGSTNTATENVYSPNVQNTRRQLELIMTVTPKSGWAIKHTVVPMTMCVATAYLSVFINISGACARLVTVMLSLVTAAVFHESTYRKVPRVHETMAIEVFTGTCLTFIFAAALESVVAHALIAASFKKRRSSSNSRNSFALEPDLMEERSGGRGHVAALWLDRVFRILYPIMFLAFNAAYWFIYA